MLNNYVIYIDLFYYLNYLIFIEIEPFLVFETLIHSVGFNMIGVYIFQVVIFLIAGLGFYTSNIYKLASYNITERLLYKNSMTLELDFNFFEKFSIQIVESVSNNILSYPWFLLGFFLFLLSTFFSFLCLTFLGLYGVFILNLCTIFIMWCCLSLTFFDIFTNHSYYYIEVGNWMFLNSNFKVNFSLFIDFVSISFAYLTTTIALCVYIFTFSYFRYEPLVERLLLFLNSFILSMVLLVSSGNLIVMFLGWEMIGMTSFFLINFWSSRIGTLKAAFKAYSFNKLSDVFIFISVVLIFNAFYSLDTVVILNSIHLYLQYDISFGFLSISFIDALAFSLLGAAFIKSAQFGAHIWLPDSMEAPVPASALIHSATLVSAGIYLLLRFSPIFQISSNATTIIAIMGSLTAFYGGWVSAFQSDLKRILAYSTISHCGFLMVVFTSFVPEYTILYLYIHGFFKAAVFLSVGNVLRFNRNIQDFRRMGGLYKYLPFDSIACFLCLINLAGLPFTFGYFIKHLLFIGLNFNTFLYYLSWSFLSIGAVIGLFYSFRLYYYTFFDVKKGKKIHYFQSSRLILKSVHYSNSSLAGNLAISSLFILAYFISIYMFNTCLNISLNSGIMVDGEYYLNFYTTFIEYSSILLNGGIINNLVVFLIIAILFSKWRFTIKFWQSINLLSVLFIFLIVFWLFFTFFN